METVFECLSALDVRKAQVIACVRVSAASRPTMSVAHPSGGVCAALRAPA